jgi:hypothetical protein
VGAGFRRRDGASPGRSGFAQFHRRFEFGDALVGSTEIAQVFAFSGLQFVDAGAGRAGDRL